MWDIRSNFGVSPAEFYRSVWRVVDAINDVFSISFPIDDVDKLNEIANGFAAKSRQRVLRHAVGAIDGCCVWQKNPGVSVHNPRRYYCARKDKFALLLMAICDAERRVLWFDVSCTPTTHDSLAWTSTALGQQFAADKLPHPYYLLGDNAFVCSRSMISPGKDDNFNFEHSSLRINIECCFGELVRRWGILWKALEMSFEKRAAVIGCCIRLHNYCVEARLDLEDDEVLARQSPETGRMSRPPVVDSNGVILDDVFRGQCPCEACRTAARDTTRSNTARREELEAAVRNAGLVRPYNLSHASPSH